MKQTPSIPSHYRPLKGHEIAHADDLCVHRNDKSRIGRLEAACTVKRYPMWEFFRRRHVKVNDDWSKRPVQSPLVQFKYPVKDSPWQFKIRSLRLIGANSEYLIGLDLDNEFKFKKFLRKKIWDSVNVVEFNPSAVK